MSAPLAIGSISKSLRNLLLAEMSVDPVVPVTILGPGEPSDDRRVNLFLYRVQEHPQLRNLDWTLRPGTADELVPPPLSLQLFYLLTAYAPTDAEIGNADAHAILGDAMRVLYEYPVVPAAQLADDLDDAHEQVRVMQVPFESDEVSQVWGTFSEPFRTSVMYEVSVVQLDVATERMIAPRVRAIGVPLVSAPYAPPAISGIDPASGTPGTTVTVSGAHFDGWSASVRIGGAVVASGVALGGDSFTFDIPAAADPGFQQVAVDVSALASATFFFEVT